MNISRWLNEEINESNFEEFVYDKFLHAIDCGHIKFSRDLTRDDYKDLLNREIDFVKENNLTKTFAIIYNCVMKAWDYKVKTQNNSTI